VKLPTAVGPQRIGGIINTTALVRQGDDAEEEVVGLIDSGSQINLVSTSWAKMKGFRSTGGTPPNASSFGNDLQLREEYLLTVRVPDAAGEIQDHLQYFYGYHSGSHTIILGTPWLQTVGSGFYDWVNGHWYYGSGPTLEILSPADFEVELEGNAEVHALYAIPIGRELWVSVSTAGVDAPTLTIPRQYRKFAEVFSDIKSAAPPVLEGAEHAIETTADPPFGPLYSLSSIQLKALLEYIESALRKGWIVHSKSPAGAPILFVPKKDGGLRLCVDYRGLNKVTIKNRYPLPLIGEILDRLVGAKRYTKLDLKDAYHRIRIKQSDQWKTAFRTRYGHFEYQVMPFGLTNAPATFQAYINQALSGLLDDFCIVYLDDILIYSRNEEDHTEHVRRVLERLKQYGLYANLRKCIFSATSVEFLGFIIGTSGISADPGRVATIAEWPEPQSFVQVQQFLGFANFYRRFIYQYSKIVAPITDLLLGSVKGKKTGPFEFLEAAQAAFRAIKKAFSEAPVLHHFNPELHIRVETDSSGFALAGILSQPEEGIEDPKQKHWHPVAFWSRKMTDVERRYETYDQELLSIVECFKQWRHYLEGSRYPVRVLTDHNNLRYFMTTKRLNGRQVRWALALSPFDFEISYRPGNTNPADAPSRRPDYVPVTGPGIEDLLPTFQNKMKGNFMKVLSSWVSNDPGEDVAIGRIFATCVAVTGFKTAEDVTPQPLRGDTQEEDRGDVAVWSIEAGAGRSNVMPRICARVCAASETVFEEPLDTVKDVLLVLQKGDSFTTAKRERVEAEHRVNAASPGPWSVGAQGLLYWNSCIYVPDDASMRQELLRIHHDDPLAGHFGAEKTAELLRRKFYWKGQSRDVHEYVSSCAACQRNKPHRHRPYGELSSLPHPTGPWKEITMDFITGLPNSLWRSIVYDAILVIVDRYTKMAHYVPCQKTIDAEHLADHIMDRIIGHYGVPEGIVTDRGSVFTSNYWSNICYYLKVQRKLSTAFHPQTDGQTERQNQTLEAYLRAYCNEQKDDWAERLWMAEFAYNNSQHSSTHMTPFRALYGYEPALPPLMGLEPPPHEVPSAKERIENLLKAREILKRNWIVASTQQARQYNKRHTPKKFNIKDWVFLSSKNIRFRAGKLSPKMIGPFQIIGIVGTQAYKLDLPPLYSRLHPVFHVSLLEDAKLRQRDNPGSVVTPELEDGEEEEWEIEGIVDHRQRGGAIQYLVRWKGWSKEYDEWIHEGYLEHAQDMVAAYRKGNATKSHVKQQSNRKRKRN
jgi:hypothetical protein